ncbi:hypothetical protein FRC12_014010, partial [Ceratobasidium sp. 428]
NRDKKQTRLTSVHSSTANEEDNTRQERKETRKWPRKGVSNTMRTSTERLSGDGENMIEAYIERHKNGRRAFME